MADAVLTREAGVARERRREDAALAVPDEEHRVVRGGPSRPRPRQGEGGGHTGCSERRLTRERPDVGREVEGVGPRSRRPLLRARHDDHPGRPAAGSRGLEDAHPPAAETLPGGDEVGETRNAAGVRRGRRERALQRRRHRAHHHRRRDTVASREPSPRGTCPEPVSQPPTPRREVGAGRHRREHTRHAALDLRIDAGGSAEVGREGVEGERLTPGPAWADGHHGLAFDPHPPGEEGEVVGPANARRSGAGQRPCQQCGVLAHLVGHGAHPHRRRREGLRAHRHPHGIPPKAASISAARSSHVRATSVRRADRAASSLTRSWTSRW